MTNHTDNHYNNNVTFLPQTSEHTTPCVEIGGIQVYTYFHRGQLRISVHYDTAEPDLLDDNHRVATEITIGGTTVYDTASNT